MTSGPGKKHPCPDCRMCQQCAESRCHVCRGEKGRGPEKNFAHMSMADQIRHFDMLNCGPCGRSRAPEGYSFPKAKNDV